MGVSIVFSAHFITIVRCKRINNTRALRLLQRTTEHIDYILRGAFTGPIQKPFLPFQSICNHKQMRGILVFLSYNQ